jgi:hypothetical protein
MIEKSMRPRPAQGQKVMISYRPLVLQIGQKLRINPSDGPDRDLDRNDADDGTGATDTHPNDGSNGSGRRRSSKACIAGILD